MLNLVCLLRACRYSKVFLLIGSLAAGCREDQFQEAPESQVNSLNFARERVVSAGTIGSVTDLAVLDEPSGSLLLVAGTRGLLVIDSTLQVRKVETLPPFHAPNRRTILVVGNTMESVRLIRPAESWIGPLEVYDHSGHLLWSHKCNRAAPSFSLVLSEPTVGLTGIVVLYLNGDVEFLSSRGAVERVENWGRPISCDVEFDPVLGDSLIVFTDGVSVTSRSSSGAVLGVLTASAPSYSFVELARRVSVEPMGVVVGTVRSSGSSTCVFYDSHLKGGQLQECAEMESWVNSIDVADGSGRWRARVDNWYEQAAVAGYSRVGLQVGIYDEAGRKVATDLLLPSTGKLVAKSLGLVPWRAGPDRRPALLVGFDDAIWRYHLGSE